MWIDDEIAALMIVPLVEIAYRRKAWRRVPDSDVLVKQAKEILTMYRVTHGQGTQSAEDFLLLIDEYLGTVLTVKSKAAG